jgi:membrane-associated phospholipid phosphatase
MALVMYGSTISKTKGLPNDLSVRTFRNDHFSSFHTKIDDYAVFGPVALAGIAKISGLKSESTYMGMALKYTGAMVFANIVIQPMKYGFRRLRPDNSSTTSFPSGHTTLAFVGAELVHQEFHNPWLSAGAYTLATGVGAMRILNDRHWYSDVIVGAGIGILSTKVVYWAYHKYTEKKKKRVQKLVF